MVMTTKTKKASVPPSVTGREATTATAAAKPSALFDKVKTVETDKAAAKLMEECGAVRITWTWFRTGITVDKTSKNAMAEAAGTTDKGFNASKRLMDSKHPIVKEANELRTKVASYVKGVSLPVTKLGDAQSGKKEGGVVLVRKTDLADFEVRMTAFQSEIATMEDRVNRELPSIKAMDKQRLGRLYNPDDYPDAVQLRMHYLAVNLEPPAYLEQFAPKMFEQERKRAEGWWEDVYTNAATEFMSEFQAVIGTWCDALGPVVKIFPDETHALATLNGAEVRNRLTPKEDPAIPAGKFSIIVRSRPPGTKGQFVEQTIGPMTEAEYVDLNPNEQADKCRTFKNSTIENLLAMVGKFRALGQTISASTDFNAAVEQIEKQLRDAGAKPEQVAEELRKSKTFRGGTHALMQQLSDKLSAEIVTFSRKRRRVLPSLMADKAAAAVEP